MKKINLILTPIALAGLVSLASANIGFEGLTFTDGDYENGENLSGSSSTTNDPFGPGSGSVVTKNSSFQSGSAFGTGTFANVYNEKFDGPDGTGNFEYDYWSGWAYSRDTDTVTSGLANQYSAITGTGARGSTNYGISNADTAITFGGALDFTGRGFDVTNTTYAHNSMRDGDFFAKQFGGASGDDADFFRLSVEGFLSGSSTGTVDFYLADYRFSNNADDYIVDSWEFVDLTSLGVVDELTFDLSSSDVGDLGMNTPDYFAIDNIGAVPEPATFALLAGVAALGLVAARRRG
ncbi:MAG: DUF4465 domain-containing protein [Verrucomicrobiota bacterium]